MTTYVIVDAEGNERATQRYPMNTLTEAFDALDNGVHMSKLNFPQEFPFTIRDAVSGEIHYSQDTE